MECVIRLKLRALKHIVSLNCDITDEVNTNNSTMRVVSEKVVTEGTKRVIMEEHDGEFGKLGVSNEAEIERPMNIVLDSIEFRTPNCEIGNDVNSYNASEEGKTTRVVREKVEVGKEANAETPNISVFGANKFQNPNSDIANSGGFVPVGTDCDASGLVAVENVNSNATEDEKTVRIVIKKIVRVVRKKVVTKGPKRVKKKQPDEELGKVGVLNKAELGSTNAIEFTNLDSDIAISCASYLLGAEDHSFNVVETVET